MANHGLAHEAAHAMDRIRGGHRESDVIPLATTVSGGTLSGTFVANNFNLLTAWYTVVITATGPGGSTTITAGTLQSTCTKD